MRLGVDIGGTKIALAVIDAAGRELFGTVVVGAAFKRGVGSASRRGPGWEPIIEPGVIVGLAGGACGGDILFHEVCAEQGIETEIEPP